MRALLWILILLLAAIPPAAARAGCDTPVAPVASVQTTDGRPSGACATAVVGVPVPFLFGALIVGAGGSASAYDTGTDGLADASDVSAGAGVWLATLDWECFEQGGDLSECIVFFCLTVCPFVAAGTRDTDGDNVPDYAYGPAGPIALP